ncbi:glycosyltransferase family 2 protein [Acinetobacter sp. CFCC 10889]|uniref:glycosyltransferase family 2 protein n=1 Tax=Acinetobacter sp. CFCC 10889 TaxID=1775557 RepID=UPI001BC88424|nr:glycosyltransferase family 2 protein [Acinetobacter sp. CFCC 10889]
MMNQINEIKVSVCVVTYNQEKYLAECLEKLVNQQTNFAFEIIVGEDCSTDQTRSIVQQYYEKYPDLIVPILHEKNVGALENIRQVYAQAKGKYIAHVDGDDIALEGKLQKQFDALEAHPECNICSHDVKNIDAESNVLDFQNWIYPAGKYTLFDLFKKMPFFAHSSKMFRNNILESEWNNLFSNPDILDIDIHFLNLQKGNIIHLGENLGLYRVNVGMSNVGKKVNALLPKGNIRIYEKGLNHFQTDKEKINILKKYYARAMLNCAYNYAVYDGDISKFREYLNYSLQQSKLNKLQIIFIIVSLVPQLFFPLLKFRSKGRV